MTPEHESGEVCRFYLEVLIVRVLYKGAHSAERKINKQAELMQMHMPNLSFKSRSHQFDELRRLVPRISQTNPNSSSSSIRIGVMLLGLPSRRRLYCLR